MIVWLLILFVSSVVVLIYTTLKLIYWSIRGTKTTAVYEQYLGYNMDRDKRIYEYSVSIEGNPEKIKHVIKVKANKKGEFSDPKIKIGNKLIIFYDKNTEKFYNVTESLKTIGICLITIIGFIILNIIDNAIK